MRVLGISGCDRQRAEELVESSLPILCAKGLRVAVLIDAPDDFDLDRPGKDSYEHRRAGALEVVLSSTDRWALMHEDKVAAGQTAPALDLIDLVSRVDKADVLLVVGFTEAFDAALSVGREQGWSWSHLILPVDADAGQLVASITALEAEQPAPAAQ